MQPLHIEWKLERPMVVPKFPVHLDALLARARVEEAFTAQEENPYLSQTYLPLESAGQVWKASMLTFEYLSEPMMVQFIRKFDLEALSLGKDSEYFGSNIGMFSSGTGKYKAFDLRMQVQWVNKAQAWCIGDRDRIIELLSTIPCISKKSCNSYGKVKSFTVTEAEEAIERWKYRVLPQGSGLELPEVQYATCFQTITAPYWDQSNRVVARTPV